MYRKSTCVFVDTYFVLQKKENPRSKIPADPGLILNAV